MDATTGSSDDELIRRLRDAGGESHPVTHDPFLDLPVAEEVSVAAGAPPPGQAGTCLAKARRPVESRGMHWTEVTEGIACELPAGHPGSHRAGFHQTHLTHHWRAYEWAGDGN